MNKRNASYLEGIISIVINILLFALKLWAGIVSGSVALTADAWHTLSDSISSLIVILGAKLSSKKPDIKHPYGHGRAELIATIFIGFLLAVIAYNFFLESIEQFNNRAAANFGLIATIVTIISILVKESLAQYAFYLGKKTDSTSIKADGWHHRTDAISSIVILVGISLKSYFWWIDSALGLMVSIILFYAAFQISKEAISKLLGENPSAKLIKSIESLIAEITPLNLMPHKYKIHNYVSHSELTFHIKMENQTRLDQCHDLATKIEESLDRNLNISATIHIEPLEFEHDLD